jgi:hypothetical protein
MYISERFKKIYNLSSQIVDELNKFPDELERRKHSLIEKLKKCEISKARSEAYIDNANKVLEKEFVLDESKLYGEPKEYIGSPEDRAAFRKHQDIMNVRRNQRKDEPKKQQEKFEKEQNETKELKRIHQDNVLCMDVEIKVLNKQLESVEQLSLDTNLYNAIVEQHKQIQALIVKAETR